MRFFIIVQIFHVPFKDSLSRILLFIFFYFIVKLRAHLSYAVNLKARKILSKPKNEFQPFLSILLRKSWESFTSAMYAYALRWEQFNFKIHLIISHIVWVRHWNWLNIQNTINVIFFHEHVSLSLFRSNKTKQHLFS